MESDILILFKTARSEQDLRRAKTCLMEADRSVLVHRKDGSNRVLLVKFDPQGITPAALLAAVHDAGFEAVMAGG